MVAIRPIKMSVLGSFPVIAWSFLYQNPFWAEEIFQKWWRECMSILRLKTRIWCLSNQNWLECFYCNLKSKQAQNAAQVMLLQAINITVVLGQILLLFVATINLASTSFTLLSSFQTLRRRGRRSGHFHLSPRSWQQRRSWTWHRASTTGQSHFP